MLVGNTPPTSKRQIELYLKGDRPHDEEGTVGVLNGLKEKDVRTSRLSTTLQGPSE